MSDAHDDKRGEADFLRHLRDVLAPLGSAASRTADQDAALDTINDRLATLNTSAASHEREFCEDCDYTQQVAQRDCVKHSAASTTRKFDPEHPRAPGNTRDEIELYLRDAYAAGCNAAQNRSLFTAMEYAAREAPKLRALCMPSATPRSASTAFVKNADLGAQKTIDTVARDAARYRFRHSNYVDPEGYEYGYCKVRWKNGQVDSMLWADDAEIDAAIAANNSPDGGKQTNG